MSDATRLGGGLCVVAGIAVCSIVFAAYLALRLYRAHKDKTADAPAAVDLSAGDVLATA